MAAAGKQIGSTFLTGAGLGVGGVGLYHALKYLRNKRKQMTAQPSLAETALDISLPAPAAKTAGALLENLTTGAHQVAGRVGEIASNSLTPAWSWLDSVTGGKKNPAFAPLTNTERANITTATIGAGGLGALGAGYLLNSALKGTTQKKQRDDVAAARDQYFKELVGQNEKISADLDALYDKRAEWSDYIPTVAGTLGAAGRSIYGLGDWLSGGALNSMSEGAQTAVGVASLGAGLYGAKHMYDRTMAASRAKTLAAAAAARRRMQMANTPWVDPTDLAKIKDLAAAGQSAQSG